MANFAILGIIQVFWFLESMTNEKEDGSG